MEGRSKCFAWPPARPGVSKGSERATWEDENRSSEFPCMLYLARGKYGPNRTVALYTGRRRTNEPEQFEGR